MKILEVVHEILIMHQKRQPEPEPDVARVVLQIERELQGIGPEQPTQWDCPVFRRVEALEKLVKKHLTPNPYPGDKIGGG